MGITEVRVQKLVYQNLATRYDRITDNDLRWSWAKSHLGISYNDLSGLPWQLW